MKRCSCIASAILFLTPAPSVAQTWICVADNFVGFAFKGGQWSEKSGRFPSKFVISRPSQPHDDEKWIVKRSGEERNFATCKKDFSEGGHLFCQTLGGAFNFNKKNLRFLTSYHFGYTTDGIAGDPAMLFQGSKEGDNEPYLQIGHCTPL